MGTGSEVQLAVEARKILADAGVQARVVSMPCREWFDAQEASYRETVIPPTVKARVSVEAGIAQGWREVVGDHGRIVSIEQYGASADYARIYTEFGITAQAVADADERLEEAKQAAEDARAEAEAAQRVFTEAQSELERARDDVARLEERLD